jgi:hypothetical protein
MTNCAPTREKRNNMNVLAELIATLLDTLREGDLAGHLAMFIDAWHAGGYKGSKARLGKWSTSWTITATDRVTLSDDAPEPQVERHTGKIE